MMSMEEKLHRWQKEVDEAKSRTSELAGEKKSILRQWKDDHGLSGHEEAERFIKETENKKGELDEELQRILRQIETQYGFE